MKEQFGLGDDLSNLPPEEKILTIIAITKQLNINYLLKKYEGKIDEGTAKRLVEYGYTHGSCGSLGCTLCSLFESCQLKMVKAEGYAHQCVMFDGKLYDIMGCSTVEEMKDFVIREGGTQSDECVIEDFAPQSNSHKAVDYMIAKYIGEVFSLESSNVQ